MGYAKMTGLVIQYIGGKENIRSATYCATRLRFQLRDNGLCNKETTSDIEGMKGVSLTQLQFQIIFGLGAINLIYTEIQKQLGVMKEKSEDKNEEKGNPVQKLTEAPSDIFVSIIPAIVAGGLLIGLNNPLTSPLVHGRVIIVLSPRWRGPVIATNTLANAPFVFLPVLIDFGATKKFGGNPFLGTTIRVIMVRPGLLNAYQIGIVDPPMWSIPRFQIAAIGYQKTVLPILAASWIPANTEKRLRRTTPSWSDNLITPLLSILATFFPTFTFVGSAPGGADSLLVAGITWSHNTLGPVSGALFGFAYASTAMTGAYHNFVAIETQFLADNVHTGDSFIFSTASTNNMAQGAAVLAVLLMTKNDKTESARPASGISALLGITEPATFGVAFKLKYPFHAAMVGPAVGSAYLTVTKTLTQALGAAGFPGFISMKPSHYMNFTIEIILSMGVFFALTIVFRREVGLEKQGNTKAVPVSGLPVPETLDTQAAILYAPMKGEMIPVGRSEDEVLASKVLGDGVVINPEDGMVYTPCSGTVALLFPTGHAVGIRAESDVETLIHIGINTIQLDGQGFGVYVAQGDTTKQGDSLILADLDLIREKGLSPQTMMILPEGAGLRI